MGKAVECESCGNVYDATVDKCPYCGSINVDKEQPKIEPANIVPAPQKSSFEDIPTPKEISEKSEISCLIVVILLIVFWPAAIVYIIVKSLNK
jgi:predicted ATP-dependent serine protease